MKFILCVIAAMLLAGCRNDSNYSGSAPSDSYRTPATSNTTNSAADRLHNPQTGEIQH
jgi:hypothetical protein